METNVHQAIVVGYDGSAYADRALRWAADESLRTGDPVRLVHVLPPPYDPAAWQVELIDPATRMVELARAETVERSPRLSITAEVIVGDPITVLRELSAESGLIVLGSRGLGGFTGMLAGSVAVAVATHAACSVVLIRRLPEGLSLPVVAGFDESAHALSAVKRALVEAAVRRAPLTVVHAWRPPLPRPRTSEPWRAEEIAEIESAEREVMHSRVDPLAKQYPDVSVGLRLVAGSAGSALIAAAERAQLVVVGHRGRGGFTGLLLGSVGLHLMRHTDCPLMIVRE
ncbi:MAG: universal stress protein [Hamadaea sp.]|uniref:universal stress protein n=1 Tax=Hamadaea sp. TaxID=2024425 RepID=UPI00185457D1|nr:universal stress protein [Hamadaea sp.]NUT18868.1 universal stress protein [Hamadaea sp.]